MMTTSTYIKLTKLVRILILAGCLLAAGGRAAASDAPVYGDALATGWDNWSWDSNLNFSATTPVHSGSTSLSVQYTAPWAGLYLHTYLAYDTAAYDRLSFWIHGGSAGNQHIVVVANGNSANSYAVTAQANTWSQVTIPFSALGNPATLTDLYWQDASGGAQPVFYLDDITLLAGSIQPPSVPSLSIDVSADRHAISPDIYGMNYTDEALAAELHLPVRRWGGNATTRYNWRSSMTNTASDWYFENLPEGTVSNVAALPDGSASDQFVEQDRRTATKSLLTVPLIGWTAKTSSPRNHPYDCGFKASKYGTQQSVDSWDTNCGNGVYANGSQITGNDPTDTSEAIGPDFVAAWIAHLRSKYGSAAEGGVAYYDLDNEPMLWNSTHRDIHPQPVTYDEIRDRTSQYAPAIKNADPSAKTLGPVLWGWCAYFYSALDGCSIGSDYQNHGNQAFVPWYLGQMQAYEQQHGLRILDYLDLHYYPQANGVSLSSAGSSSTQALRLRSTRSLWDSTYIDESWISDTAPGGVAVRLIPRMRDWVNTYYPGTKLAITEYNWGGLESLNGALAQADVLGIFGREGLDLATLWSPPSAAQPGAFAFRIYRNYDGAGHSFGDVSVRATSSNQATIAVYAAQRSSDQALTVIAINKTGSGLTAPLSIAGMALPPTAAVYRYSAANFNAIEQLPDQTLSTGGFSALFPANSITLFVIVPNGSNQATLTVNKTGTGSGSVTAAPDALVWNGASGSGSYALGTEVMLSADAAIGSVFGGWSGCDSNSSNLCNVALNASKSVSALFNLLQYMLTANATGNGSGSITSSTGGINFSYPATAGSSAQIAYGTAVTLTANGSNGSTVAWSNAGACSSVSGSSSSMNCTINSMDTAKTVAATFTAPNCSYSISPATATFGRTGGKGNVAVTVSSSICSWTARSNASWITLSATNYTGSSTVKYSVARNSTGATRTGTITIADKTFTVTQSN